MNVDKQILKFTAEAEIEAGQIVAVGGDGTGVIPNATNNNNAAIGIAVNDAKVGAPVGVVVWGVYEVNVYIAANEDVEVGDRLSVGTQGHNLVDAGTASASDSYAVALDKLEGDTSATTGVVRAFVNFIR